MPSINPDDYQRVYSDDGIAHFKNIGSLETRSDSFERPALGWASSILVSNKIESCIGVAVKKCSCGSVWCPKCFKRKRAKDLASRLQRMNWKRVRMITLTIDPALYESGKEAFLDVKEKKMLPQFIHNLRRVVGINILDWMWFVEWSKNGFPHYHFSIEVEKSGRAGMIGQENIHHYWSLGRIEEKFINDENHWKTLSGYFGKHGYFTDKKEGKASQGVLPSWALECDFKIRRSGSQRLPSDGQIKEPIEVDPDYMPVKKIMRSYRVILKSCGQNVLVDVYSDKGNFTGIKLKIPYLEILKKNPGGDFRQGLGYCLDFTEMEFIDFCSRFEGVSERFSMARAMDRFSKQRRFSC